MQKITIRTTLATLLSATVLLGTVACASSSGSSFGSVSRAGIYNSLAELVNDSPQTLVGKVTESKVAYDEQLKMNVTLVTVDLYKVSDPAAETAKQVLVRQTGTAQNVGELKYMETGKIYTIFAVISDQTANPTREYDIRGVDAGIYEADASIASESQALASDATYHRLDANSGDNLPDTIHLSDIAGI